jgi:hypothetical protein
MQWSSTFSSPRTPAAMHGLQIDAAMVAIGTCGSVGWQAGGLIHGCNRPHETWKESQVLSLS